MKDTTLALHISNIDPFEGPIGAQYSVGLLVMSLTQNECHFIGYDPLSCPQTLNRLDEWLGSWGFVDNS